MLIGIYRQKCCELEWYYLKRTDPKNTEPVDQRDIHSTDEQLAWFVEINEKYGKPGVDDDWVWLARELKEPETSAGGNIEACQAE
jgi:hypothetical protein